MLNVFRGKVDVPNYKVVPPQDGELQVIHVHKEVRTSESKIAFAEANCDQTARIRPYVSGAVLRNITFTQERYESFIALQDKLHQNLARQRTLVSIGTHDLDTITGPFTYEALSPEDINFVPLNQTKKMTGAELMKFYEVCVLTAMIFSRKCDYVLLLSSMTSIWANIFT